ncbi:MAG: EVE domain-containing protein [Nitrospiraceae bacterium]
MKEECRYWLVKSEAEVFSIDDLEASPRRTTYWDGVRNYQARNFMRSMQVGDPVFFYHSNGNPPAVAGIAEVVRTAYPDVTQFDPRNPHYDPASHRAAPRWDMVDLRFVQKFAAPLSLDLLRRQPKLRQMELLRKGSRLSVQPVRKQEWQAILDLVSRVPSVRK